MLSRQLVLCLVLGLSLSARAAPPSRTWEFDLKTPGTYEVHVQHQVKRAFFPRGAEVAYTLQTREKTLQRNLPFYPKDDAHPVVVLIADIAQPQRISIIIAGLPPALLRQTRVYVIEANSRYPYEWYDPEKSVNLKAAKRIRDILQLPGPHIDLARAKLAIDQLIDPAIDVEANLRKIDAMVTKIKSQPGFNLSRTAGAQTLSLRTGCVERLPALSIRFG